MYEIKAEFTDTAATAAAVALDTQNHVVKWLQSKEQSANRSIF